MLTKFKTGVGSATIILKLQYHIPGAIMLGDALLSSECSLIVEELKGNFIVLLSEWKIAFQKISALELHLMISKLGLWSKSSSEAWQRLYWHEINLERVAKLLRSAVS